MNAFINITKECNKNCHYCYSKDFKAHAPDYPLLNLMNTVDLFVPADNRIVVPFRQYQYDSIHPTISFVGGEPTVAKTLLPLIEHIISRGTNKIYIFTNGIKLLDKEYLRQFSNTSQIMFSLSVDINTEVDFIRSVTENLMKFNFEYGYNLVVGRSEETIQPLLKLDKTLREYEPEEIRYRALSDQIKGLQDCPSSIVKFIERSRGIPYDYFIANCNWGHGSIVSMLDCDKSENPKTGRVSIAMIPVWRKTFAEIQAKRGCFIVNTKYLLTPSEGQIESKDLYNYRMKHTKKYMTESTKCVWGEKNYFAPKKDQK